MSVLCRFLSGNLSKAKSYTSHDSLTTSKPQTVLTAQRFNPYMLSLLLKKGFGSPRRIEKFECFFFPCFDGFETMLTLIDSFNSSSVRNVSLFTVRNSNLLTRELMYGSYQFNNLFDCTFVKHGIAVTEDE